MIYRPHEYQKVAEEFILAHPTAAVFLDLGLGKTVITLTAVEKLIRDSFEIRRVLVIAPLRVARTTWPDEIEKWDHLKDLSYSVAVGTEDERLEALYKGSDITIINRENVEWLVERSGYSFDFDMIVVDELSSFKNHEAKRFKALLKVRPFVKRIVGLTGTPSANGLMDLFAEFRLLDMGERLGRYITRYRLKYFEPDRRSRNVVFSYKPLPGAEKEIEKAIGDITISMSALDYLDMPDKVNITDSVVLSEGEIKRYEDLKRDLYIALGDEELTASNAAVLSGKLSQMAGGAVYSDNGEVVEIHNKKLDALEDLVEANQGKPLLVVYWYRHDKERIQERWKEARELKTGDDIADWNRGEISIGLLNASSGHGLNLQTGGNTIVWFSLTWSLELYQQTNARLWRQGQTAGSVFIHHIIVKDTIDERILSALERKREVQDALLDAVKAELNGGKYGHDR